MIHLRRGVAPFLFTIVLAVSFTACDSEREHATVPAPDPAETATRDIEPAAEPARERWVSGTPTFVFRDGYRRAHPVSVEVRSWDAHVPPTDQWSPWLVELPDGVTLEPGRVYRVRGVAVPASGERDLPTLRIESVGNTRNGGPRPKVIPGVSVAGLRLDQLDEASLEGVELAPFAVSRDEIAFSTNDVPTFWIGWLGLPARPSVAEIVSDIDVVRGNTAPDWARNVRTCEETTDGGITVYDCGGIRVSTRDPDGYEARISVRVAPEPRVPDPR